MMNKQKEMFTKKYFSILLAEDHIPMRNVLAEILSDHDYIHIVGMAANGQEAVEMALKLRPALVLMDISMPIMNGIDATRQINQLLPETKIIGLTMHNDSGIHQEMIEAGAYACLLKEDSSEKLIETVQSLLGV